MFQFFCSFPIPLICCLAYAFALGSRCIILLGERLALVVAMFHSFYPPWSSCVRGDAPVAVAILFSLFVLSRLLHRIRLSKQRYLLVLSWMWCKNTTTRPGPGISESRNEIFDCCCRHTMSPAVTAPSNLWNWYIDYLWNYDNNSWVATIAYGFRIWAILAILPTIILCLLVSTTVHA